MNGGGLHIDCNPVPFTKSSETSTKCQQTSMINGRWPLITESSEGVKSLCIITVYVIGVRRITFLANFPRRRHVMLGDGGGVMRNT